MIHIQLDDAARDELRRLRHTNLTDTARDRLEMVLLSDAGWSPPRIARHLGCHPHTARAALKGYRDHGLAALRPQPPGPPPDHQRRQVVTQRLTELLGQRRTWTSRQLAEALRPEIVLSPRQVLRYLALLGARYRRTASTVRHKQDPAKVERAKQVLAGLKKKRGRAA
jgi:putative transposase